MSFINRKTDKTRSLDAFKASAANAVLAESIDAITGGTQCICHGPSKAL